MIIVEAREWRGGAGLPLTCAHRPLRLLTHSFTVHTFIEHLLYASYYARHFGYRGEQNKDSYAQGAYILTEKTENSI